MIDTTINELKTTIGEIRDTINEGIQNRSDLTEDDKLKDDAPLVDYIEAITKLKANITQAGQQIIILYTYAESKAAAEKKQTPTISWKKDENEEYVIEYGEFNPSEWVPSGAIQQDPTHKLWIRFASITKDASDADFGEPIQMTGDQGPKGDQGIPGTDAVILTAVHRLVKLYCISDTEPTIPAFRKDTSSNSEFENDLDVTRIYYGDETNPTYIDEGDWTSEYTGGPNKVVWEIDVDINSKGNEVKILSTPIRKHITVTSTKVEYAANNSGVSAPTSGWVDSRPSMEDNSHLWSKTITTYSNGYTHEYTSLIQELPTVIKSITTTYLATQDTTPPDENAKGWSSDIPMIGPVIWKKEVTEYTAEIEGKDSNIKTTITPVAIQGASGIKFIGTVTSESDLPTEALVWDEEYIGRMGMLVGADTYIWYGTSEPTPAIEGIKRIGSNYWLDMGPIHVCDWDAKEGELGYIKNRTHYVEKGSSQWITPNAERSSNSIYIDVPAMYDIIECEVEVNEWQETITIPVGKSIVIEREGSKYTFSAAESAITCPDNLSCSVPYVNVVSNTYSTINPNFIPTSHECELVELLAWKSNELLISGHTYVFAYGGNEYSVKALSKNSLDWEIISENEKRYVDWSKSGIDVDPDQQYTTEFQVMHNRIKITCGADEWYYYNGQYFDDFLKKFISSYSPNLILTTTRIIDNNGNDYNPNLVSVSGKNNVVIDTGFSTVKIIGNDNFVNVNYPTGTVVIRGSKNKIVGYNTSISGAMNIYGNCNLINGCVCNIGSSSTLANSNIVLGYGKLSNTISTSGNFYINGPSGVTSIISGILDCQKVEAAEGFYKQ